MKEWRENEQEVKRLKSRKYYQENKERISARRKEKRLEVQHDSTAESSASPTQDEVDQPGQMSFFTSRMVKKRAMDKVKSALPNSPGKKTEALVALLDSLRTRKSLSETAIVEQEEDLTLARALISDVSSVVNMAKYKRSDGARASMRIGLSMLCGSSVAEGNMLKRLSEALKINRCRLAMSVAQSTSVLCDKDALWKLTKKKTRSNAISNQDKQLAQDFWSSPGVSRATGNKKDIKRERVGPKQYVFHEKQVLEKTQTEVYEEFKVKYPNVHIGQRAFESCKPFYVIEARPQDRQSCCCRAHVEIRMLFKACMTFRRNILKGEDQTREAYPVYEHLSDVVKETLCDKGDTGAYHRLECINRQCEECGVNKLKLMPQEIDTSQSACEVKWERFKYVPIATEGDEKRRLKIVTKISTAGEMFAYFKSLLDSFSGHQFRANWQQEQMKRTINNLPPGHICCVLDYSENYSCRYQDQIQSLYFAQSQASIHITILHHHKLPEENQQETDDNQDIVTEHLFVISPDYKHDHASVHECRSIVVDYLRQIEYLVVMMHEWTDQCSAQYKSCFGFQTVRNYFETSHAKGPQDGDRANIKHKADMAVVRRQVVIQNAHDLYSYAKENLTEPSSSRYKSQSVTLKQRIFFYVEQHRRNRHRRFKQIKGSRQIHSVISTEDSPGSQIKTRLLSCYCDNCFEGQYDECENCEWVEPWEDVVIEQEESTRRVTRSESEDQRVGIKDLITENSIVAIASGGHGADYYLLKVTARGPEKLQVPTKDDWGGQYLAGAEVICGHFLLPVTGSNRLYKIDIHRKAILYAATARFICSELCSLSDQTELVLSEKEHLDILNSLEGF